MSIRIVCALLVSSLALACAAKAAGAAAEEGAVIALDDVGTRLQFDFYMADANALRRDLAGLGTLEVPAALATLKSTYAAFGEWKLAEVLRTTDQAAAVEAARACGSELEKTVAIEARRAGLFALLSICQRLTADLQGRVKAPLSAARSRQNLERAVALSPKSPQVLLVEGIDSYERSRGAADLASARTKLNAAAAAFEAAPAAATDHFANAMNWGAAEAWAYLGRVQLALGDTTAARDAFERALVIAEEYSDVRERLRGITGARSP